MRSMPLRVAMLAAECEPWAKVGGLGDMVDALARALGRLRDGPDGLPVVGRQEARACAAAKGEGVAIDGDFDAAFPRPVSVRPAVLAPRVSATSAVG